MSTELPDFATAPAWLDAMGEATVGEFLVSVQHGQRDHAMTPQALLEYGPWTPLDTADEWVKRIDRDKLAKVIGHALNEETSWEDRWSHDVAADAVLAALPELMGGEQA